MQPPAVEVFLELGHQAGPRDFPTVEGYTHDWKIWVRGPNGNKIQHFIERVIFNLHDSFPNPRRVFNQPPYEVEESGYAGFELPIEIYFRNKEEPKMITYNYDLNLLINDSVSNIRREKLTFQNPREDFKKKLIKSGGNPVNNITDRRSMSKSRSRSPESRASSFSSSPPPPRRAHSRSTSRQPLSPVSRPRSSNNNNHTISSHKNQIKSKEGGGGNHNSSSSKQQHVSRHANNNPIAHKNIRSPATPGSPAVRSGKSPKVNHGIRNEGGGKSIKNRSENEFKLVKIKEEPMEHKVPVIKQEKEEKPKPIKPINVAPEFVSLFGEPINVNSPAANSNNNNKDNVSTVKVKTEPRTSDYIHSNQMKASEKKIPKDDKVRTIKEESIKKEKGEGDIKTSNKQKDDRRSREKDRDNDHHRRSVHESTKPSTKQSSSSKKLLFTPSPSPSNRLPSSGSGSDSDSSSESRKRKKKKKKKDRKKDKSEKRKKSSKKGSPKEEKSSSKRDESSKSKSSKSSPKEKESNSNNKDSQNNRTEEVKDDKKVNSSKESSSKTSFSKGSSNSNSSKNESRNSSSKNVAIEKEKSDVGTHLVKDKSSKDVKKINIKSTTVSYNKNPDTGAFTVHVKEIKKEISRESESSKKSKSKSTESRDNLKKESKGFESKSTKEEKVDKEKECKKKENERRDTTIKTPIKDDSRTWNGSPSTPGKNLNSSNGNDDLFSPPSTSSKGSDNSSEKKRRMFDYDDIEWGSDGDQMKSSNNSWKKPKLDAPDEVELKVIRDRINRLRDKETLQKVVDQIESCENCWYFVPETNRIEFDLMKLDQVTLVKLKKLMNL